VIFKSSLLYHDTMSSSRTVVRRRKSYGFLGSGATTRTMPLPEKRQLAKDPLVPGQATLTSFGSLEFTAKFGRPL